MLFEYGLRQVELMLSIDSLLKNRLCGNRYAETEVRRQKSYYRPRAETLRMSAFQSHGT